MPPPLCGHLGHGYKELGPGILECGCEAASELPCLTFDRLILVAVVE